MSDSALHIDIAGQLGALDLRVSETWPASGITALFGPSGSGKTSLLRMIAGFAKPDSGRVTFGGKVWSDRAARTFVPPHKRPVGLVHQGGYLLPHLSVRKNLHYAENRALKRHTNPSQNGSDIAKIIDGFDLHAMEARKPDTLSGGERQRVALAQALLGRPKLLLLDEPLSALDARRKADILAFLGEMQTVRALPIIYVSHDIGVVSRIADRVAIIDSGRIIDAGDTTATLNQYGFESGGAARTGTLLSGMVAALDPALQLMTIAIGPHALTLPIDKTLSVGRQLRIVIHASDVVLSTQSPVGLSVQNALQGTILAIAPETEGPMAGVTLSLDGTDGATLVAQITQAAVSALALREGLEIYALIKTAVLAS